jgi:hypothetical protein
MRLDWTNGWQRLWLMATCLALIWCGAVHPIIKATEVGSPSEHLRRHLEQELQSPACQPYVTRPLSELQPTSDRSCYIIYSQRKNYKDTVPYTIDVFDAEQGALWWEHFLMTAAVSSAFAIVVSGVAYFAGLLIGWIARGFKPET